MNIPAGSLETAVVIIGGFVFKVVFGLIQKNKDQSEIDDRRLEAEIKELRKEMKEIEERYRSNDRELYKVTGDVQQELSYMKGKLGQ